MTDLRRLIGLLLAHLLLRIIRILRLSLRAVKLQRQEGPGWRRMIRARIALRMIRLSHAVLGLSAQTVAWLEG